MKRSYLVPLFSLVAALGILGWRHRHQEEVPIRITSDGLPPLPQSSGVEASIAQCRKLMTVIAQNGGDIPNPCPDEIYQLQKLADGKYAEDKTARKACNIAILEKDPDIALYTSIYARMNRSYYLGDRSMTRATGFFLVGYRKTGEVKQIPIEQVRWKRRCAPTEDANCFPGQGCYADSLPHPDYRHETAPH